MRRLLAFLPWPRLGASERSVARLHLLATLSVMALVALALTGFFSWQAREELSDSLARVESIIHSQQRNRLSAEMASAVSYLDFMRSRTEDRLRQSLATQVDEIMLLVEAIHQRESGRRPEAEVKQLIIEALRPIRFYEGRGYYFIDDLNGRFVLLPTAPKLEGTLSPDNRDDTGHPIMQGLIEAARQPRGQGYSRYRWYLPDNPKVMADKLAYVRHFAPYNWLIGTGDYTHKWEERQQQEALAHLRSLRFGDSGYFGLIDAQGRSLLSPSKASLEGLHYSQMSPQEGRAVEQLYEAGRRGGGFVQYEWQDPRHGGEPAGKTALVQQIKPWGWVLAATVFDDELYASFRREREAFERGGTRRHVNQLLALLGALAVGGLASWLFSRWSAGLFGAYQRQHREHIEALQQQATELRIAATAFESQEGMIVADVQGVILKVNQAFTDITGYTPAEAVGQTTKLLKSGRHDAAFYDAMWTSLAQTGRWQGEIWNRRKSGDIFPEWLTITAVQASDGAVTHYVSTLTDITHRKAAENEIRHLAFFDPLTGLPNRRLLLDRLRHALAASVRRQRGGALIFMDLDNFKTLNDTLGHDKGDLLLRQVGDRLKACVRDSDTVARLGGDEFVVMLEDLPLDPQLAAEKAEAVCEGIRAALNQPYDLRGHEYHCTPSMGVSLFERQVPLEELLQRADLAMYQAKAAGRDAIRFFDPAMQALVTERASLEADLRLALRQDQLLLYYQAQVSSAGQVVGAEALVRWRHPVRGLVSPAEFIPLAEDTGLILPLGEWVLEAGCRQLAEWARDPQREHLTLAINVSARQYRLPDFVELVLATLARTGAPARRLKLELTESLLLHDVEDIIAKMSALQAHGVGFSLDDFGTGYSSLSYLKRLPLDQLKIDQSFVRDLLDDANDATIARTIIALGKSLGLSVIAEGVETTAHRDCLAGYGCDAYQGYLYGRPGPVEALPLSVAA